MKVLTWKFIITLFAISYIFANSILPRIIAFNYVSKNITLVLEGCENEDCHIVGDWTKDVITLEQLITKQNGEVISFKLDDVKLIKVPPQH